MLERLLPLVAFRFGVLITHVASKWEETEGSQQEGSHSHREKVWCPRDELTHSEIDTRMWITQVRVRLGANNSLLLWKPSMESLSSTLHPSPISSYPQSPSSLVSLVLAYPRSLSTGACSPAVPRVSVNDNCSDFGESTYTFVFV